MAKEITAICKNCGKEFKYDEECYWLMAEKGESRFERCEECREEHGKRLSGLKVSYFLFQEVRPSRDFNFFDLRYTSHGERVLQEKEKERVDYSENLTITDEEILSLYQMLERNQMVVIAAPTAAGKSTFIPAKLIESVKNYPGDFVDRLHRQGQIIITQPRILATTQVPQTSARMIGSSVGPTHLLSYRHSGEDLSSRWNLAISITDGTLPNWIREGRLDQYSLIMVDEAHERSCNIDYILGFLRQALSRVPQPRLIISSATINTQKFLDAFREANISSELFDLSFLIERRRHKGYIHFWKDENVYRLSKEGKLEKVKDCRCWLCQKSIREKEEFWRNQKDNFKEFELPEVTANFVSKILKETKKGDILVFLHGEKVINETVRKIEARWRNQIEAIPAYRRIQDDVEKMLAQKTNKRRVIVGTNLLETSVTLQGAVYGIDSGYIKEAKWDFNTQSFTLPSERHSQDGRKQRWGRLGRTEDGYVYNLYSKEEFEKAEEHTQPEITRSCLEDSLVNLKGVGITDVDQFLWMEKPADHPQMAGEIKRAHQALKDRGIIDQKGEIVERTLELLSIPRSQPENSFLFSADEQGILFEAMTTLWLMSTREGEARTGANLYTKAFGLLLWNPIWNAKTKMKVWAIHQGLRIGCQDDLDFVMKLAICLQKAEAKGIAEKWARYHFVNYERIQKILSEIDEIVTKRLGEEREESVREIDLSCLEKIRSLMVATWPEKVVNLNPGEPITYPVTGKTKVGVVSPHCVGNWRKQKRAIVTSAIEEEAIVEGYPRQVPTASFMVQLPGQNFEGSGSNLFIDQIFPVGSRVRVKEEDGKAYIIKLEEFPSPIKVNYQATLGLPEDYEELKERREEEEIPFNENFLIDEELTVPVEGKWIGEITTNQARIVEWIEQDGQPVAVLSPFKETEITLGKGKKDTLEVKIHQVAREPISKGGWIVAATEEGFDIAIELSEMSLSPQGPGLEWLEGRVLNLIVKEVDEKDLPKLSNIKRIISDLRNLKEEISGSAKATKVSQRNFIELAGFVTEINEEEEKAIVVVPRENGVFHPFEVAQTYVPGGNLKNLRIGEEVSVCLFSRSERDKISIEYFTEKEIKNRPKEWELEEEEGKLLVPLSLEDNDLRDWPARPEAIDFVKRHSWQFCLNARIGSLKERLSAIKPGDIVIGVIKEIEYDEDETIKSARVLVEGDIPAFVFGSDLSTGKLEVEIPFLVKTVDPESGLLRLVEKAKEEERERKQKEWIERTKANIRRWENNIKKARESIERLESQIRKIEANMRKIGARLNKTESPIWIERYKQWIAEDRSQIEERIKKIQDRRRSIQEWEEKILDAKSKLANMD